MADEYIRKEDAKDALQEKVFHNLTDEYYGTMQVLDELPAADVVPVRHGKWKKIGEWGHCYRCNRCGNYLDFDGVNAGRGSANFCPNCGAKMDGERKE